jgi:hypothetical protein
MGRLIKEALEMTLHPRNVNMDAGVILIISYDKVVLS